MANPYFHIPMFPTFNVPEIFGKAMSYEGQIHAICHAFQDVTDGYNQVIDYINESFPWTYADPIEWDPANSYTEHTIVYVSSDGTMYVSIQDVPAYTSIDDINYWVPLIDYNANKESYSVLDYPGVLNDGTPCQDAIQNAIDTIPAYSKVVFPTGTYSFDTLRLRDTQEYDFCGSTLFFSGVVGILASGTQILETTLQAPYTAGQIELETANSLSSSLEGALVFFSDPDNLFHEARTYYHRGGVFKVAEASGHRLVISESMPLDMSMNTRVVFYRPISVHIKNIGNMKHIGDMVANARGIRVIYCSDCVLEKIRITNEMYSQVVFLYDYNCELKDSTFNLGSELANSYCFINGTTSFVTVDSCTMRGSWAAISSGNEEPVMNFLVRDSSLMIDSSFSTQYGYGAHENDFNTTIERCYIEGANFANSVHVRDSRIKFNEANACNIMFASYPQVGNATFENVEFIPNPGVQNNLRFAVFPQTDVVNYHQGSISFTDCKFADTYDIQGSYSTTIGYSSTQDGMKILDKLEMTGCKNFRLVFNDNTRTKLVRLDCVEFQTYTRTDFMDIDVLIWCNSPIHRGYASTLFRIGSGVHAYLSNLAYDPSDGTDANGKISPMDGSVVYLANVVNDCTSANFAPQAGSKVRMQNCKLSIFQWATLKQQLDVIGDAIDHNGIHRLYENTNGVQYQGTFDGTGYVFS